MSIDIRKKIILNTDNTRPNNRVVVKQGCLGTVTLVVTINDKGGQLVIPSGSSAKVRMLKPDRKQVLNDCTVSENEVLVEVTQQMQAYPGDGMCEIIITHEDKPFTSASFPLTIEPNVHDDSQIESAPEYTTILNTLVKVEEAGTMAESAYETAREARTVLEEAQDMIANGKIILKDPVSSFSALATTYPNAIEGWTVKVLSDGKIYRYNGTEWKWIDTVTASSYDALLSQLAQKADYSDIAGLASATPVIVSNTASMTDTSKNYVLDSTMEIYQWVSGAITATGKYYNETVFVNGSIEERKFENRKRSRNLFDIDNKIITNVYYPGGKFASSINARVIVIPCEAKKTYTVSRQIISSRFSIGTCVNFPTVNENTTTFQYDYTAKIITVTAGANDAYLYVYFFHAINDAAIGIDAMLKGIQIEEGANATDYVPYWIMSTRKESLPEATQKSMIYTSKQAWTPKLFTNATAPSFNIPSGANDIGMISVMDMREIPIQGKIDNLYAWCSPHDYPGGIYLYTAPHPMGQWTYRGIVISTSDFAPTSTAGARHISSPDVIWDPDLDLDGNGQHGAFRIYFHYSGELLPQQGTQRTFLAFSKTGQTLHSFLPHDNYTKAVIPIPPDIYGPDGGYSTYARFIRKGNLWLSFYSASDEEGMTGILVAISYDNGFTFKPTRQYFLPPNMEEGSYTGVPGLLEYNDTLYITYFSYTTSEGAIRLASVHDNGGIVRYGDILTPSSSGWDNFRVCESYPLLYDNKLYLFYSGRDDREGHIQGKWPNTQLGVVCAKEVYL